jgi:uncharacterized protein YggE
MSRFFDAVAPTTAAAAVLALAFAAPAGAQQPAVSPGTLTVVGTGEVTPTPRDRNSSASIAAAVEQARNAALPRAIGNGRGRAAALASATGLTLGPLLAVAETASLSSVVFPYPTPYGENGTFGPGRYCGTIRRATFTRDAAGNRKRTGLRSVRSCRVPREVTRSITMTFAASSTQA